MASRPKPLKCRLFSSTLGKLWGYLVRMNFSMIPEIGKFRQFELSYKAIKRKSGRQGGHGFDPWS